jgi:uncharacterized protein (TIGR02646 family)
VVAALLPISGAGEVCMYCSANEPSHVEHFRPLAHFPDQAFEYTNYLWTCDICNRTHKGERFPPHTEPGAVILNPLDEDVWAYFLIEDEFGQLVARIDEATGERLERAASTMEVVGLDRETLALRRRNRFASLKDLVGRTLADLAAGTVTAEEARTKVDVWRATPFQVDVADYFLNGPGRDKEPFRSLFTQLGG